MIETLWNVVWPLGAPPLGAWLWQVLQRHVRWMPKAAFFTDWLGIAAFGTAAGLIAGPRLYGVSSGVSFIAGVIARWWWRRKDRKRALAALGYKSRALLAAVVRRAREAAQPRPVLRPQRQGAP